MYETVETLLLLATVIVFGVCFYIVGYISHWRKVNSLLPFSEIGKAISVMIGVGTLLNFDLNMFFQDKAERGLEEKKGNKGFAQTPHTPFYNSKPPANNKR